MDLKDFETTTTYAIQAVYTEYWNIIPEKYRLMEKAQVQLSDPDEYAEQQQDKNKKETPLTYKKVEQQEYKDNDLYTNYCKMLNSGNWFDITPFYDPQLDFENRLHYKLAGVDFPNRQKPWFIITWNFGNGILKSSLTRRRFESAVDKTPGGEDVMFDFMNTEMDLTMAIYSNTLQGLIELQENIMINRREKFCVDTQIHSVLGSFPVSVDTIESTVAKLPRDKGTLRVLTLNLKVDYPIIGNVRDVKTGIIKEIHMEVDSTVVKLGDIDVNTAVIPNTHEVLSRDIITESTP